MSYVKIPVALLVYDHKHGSDYSLYKNVEAAVEAAADIARSNWANRMDMKQPDDHSGLSDQQVLDAYFQDDGGEYYSTEARDVGVPIDTLKELIAKAEAKPDTISGQPEVKIELPAGFWRQTEPGRYLGTLHIRDVSFHVEAIEVEYRAPTMHMNAFYAVHSGQDQLDHVFDLAGDSSALRTVNIDGKPHVVFMTPYSA